MRTADDGSLTGQADLDKGFHSRVLPSPRHSRQATASHVLKEAVI